MKRIEVFDYIEAQKLLNRIAKERNLRLAFQNARTFQTVYAVSANGDIPLALYRDKILKRTFLYVF
jgi:hypothetical protein